MTTKMTTAQIQTVVDRFIGQAVLAYDGHAYAAGYLGSMVSHLLQKLPIEVQLQEVDVLLTSPVWTKKNEKVA